MKKLFSLFFVLMLELNFIACDDSSSKPNAGVTHPTTASAFLHYTFPDQLNYTGTVADEAAALFTGYTLTDGITYDATTTVSGYAADQFVKKDTVIAATPDLEGVLGTNDARKLYSVVVVSNNDSFDNRTKFAGASPKYNADLRWDQFTQGYLLNLTYSGKIFFPTAVGIAKMYNIQYAHDLYMFRKIEVKRPDAAGSIATFEVGATTESYVSDADYTTSTGLTTTKFTVTTMNFGSYTNVKAISLSQFITDYVTDVPSSYAYKIVALDDTYKDGWTYANIQSAYYLPDYDLICQVDSTTTPGTSTMVSGTKINFPVRIELISAAAVEYSYSSKNPPAYASYVTVK